MSTRNLFGSLCLQSGQVNDPFGPQGTLLTNRGSTGVSPGNETTTDGTGTVYLRGRRRDIRTRDLPSPSYLSSYSDQVPPEDPPNVGCRPSGQTKTTILDVRTRGRRSFGDGPSLVGGPTTLRSGPVLNRTGPSRTLLRN